MRNSPFRYLFALLMLPSLMFSVVGAEARGAQSRELCDRVKYIADVSVPDGTIINGGSAFTKTWRLKNIGDCTWSESYSLVFSSGEQMGAPSVISLPQPVRPERSVDVSVNMLAPTSPGRYRGYWLLRNPKRGSFGIGPNAAKAFWVDITVSTPPVPVTTATPPDSEADIKPAITGITRALIISIDGMRPEVPAMVWMPNLRSLMQRGAYTLSAQTVYPSSTLPAHSSMLVGVCPSKHGFWWDDYNPANGTVPGTDIFDLAHTYGYQTVMIIGKKKLSQITDAGSLDLFRFIDDRDAMIAERLVAGFPTDFGLMFIHFPAVDQIGHEGGWLSEGQLKQARRADQALGKILAELDKRSLRDETLIIVTADHGGHGNRHGTRMSEDMTIPWVISGPSVVTTVLSSPVYIMDTAATAAYALGLPIPEEWDGEAITEAFGEPPQARQSAGCP